MIDRSFFGSFFNKLMYSIREITRSILLVPSSVMHLLSMIVPRNCEFLASSCRDLAMRCCTKYARQGWGVEKASISKSFCISRSLISFFFADHRSALRKLSHTSAKGIFVFFATRKIFSDEAKTLHQLDGCIVEIDGPRFGPFMIEQKWRILDAGDGSFPFLGKIEQRGIQYFIHDHNTQSMFKLQGEQDFSSFTDKKVLIVGFVIGSHDIRVLRIIELQ